MSKNGSEFVNVMQRKSQLFFPDTVYIITKALNGFLMIQRQIER